MDQELLFRTFGIIITTFITVVVLIPFIKKIAIQINAIDIPRNRHIHTKPIPKLGGVAMFIGFLIGYMIFGIHSVTMNAVLIGSFFIILIGVVDDIVELKPITKFSGQLAATCVIVFYGNMVMNSISAFGFELNFPIGISHLITIFFILGCINCINLIDGLDGLSGGISFIYFLTVGIISIIKGSFGLEYILSFIMVGSVLGFLAYNFNPATIFAGDSGSMFMGFIISVIALLGFKNVTLTSLIIPLLILAIPILDTLFAIIRRLIKGQSIAQADKSHIHHQFLSRNFTQRQTVLIIYIVDALFAFSSIVYVLRDRVIGYILYILLFIIVLIFVLKTNVLFEHKKGNKK